MIHSWPNMSNASVALQFFDSCVLVEALSLSLFSLANFRSAQMFFLGSGTFLSQVRFVRCLSVFSTLTPAAVWATCRSYDEGLRFLVVVWHLLKSLQTCQGLTVTVGMALLSPEFFSIAWWRFVPSVTFLFLCLICNYRYYFSFNLAKWGFCKYYKCMYVLYERLRKTALCLFCCKFLLLCRTLNTQEAHFTPHWLALVSHNNIIKAVYHDLNLNVVLEHSAIYSARCTT